MPEDSKTPQSEAIERLFALIRTLRGPGGCPWDRDQRIEDILSDLIEETYELEWALARHGDSELIDEMGDVLFVLCFAIAVKSETAPEVTIDRIATHAHDKIKRRHPHVFGDAKAGNKHESLVHWERIKAEERAAKGNDGNGFFADVPANLPALRHAEKIQERAASVGFDWDNPRDIVHKLREELDELEEALTDAPRERVEDELGDVLFSVVNVTRYLQMDASRALTGASRKFIDRFQRMQGLIESDGRRLADMTLAEMDVYWERAKRGR